MIRFVFNRGHIVYLHDIVMAGLSFFLALYLRLGDDVWTRPYLGIGIAMFASVAAAVFWSMRLYGGVWRYASLNDLIAIAKAATLAVLIFLPLMFLITRLEAMPRSIMIINWFVLMALLGGPRFLYRLMKDRHISLKMEQARDGARKIPVLLLGAGDEAELFIRAMSRGEGAEYLVAGIVSLSGTRVGRAIHGIDVLGSVEELAALVEKLSAQGRKPQRLILTKDDLKPEELRQLLETGEQLGMTLARLPRLTEFKDGAKDRIELRPVALEDLLGRPQAVLDREGMRNLIQGRSVLITGAGGSIGSELVRQIADFGPARLVLVESSEFNLYSIDMELAERWPDLARVPYLGDVRDAGRMDHIFKTQMPDLVFHAAAFKHVPMVEFNPVEGVRTNVCGTRIVADACRAAGVKAMVLISTDKAVNPTNVMGAAKRMAEMYCQALDLAERDRAGQGNGPGTRYITVRFGNVLGSTGSVVPLFQRQLAQGGPLTVTHPEMTRYFMTIREAVELVLQASALGASSDTHRGQIFVLDMGKPVKIVDLARQMIRLAGRHPDQDIKIVYTGLRPGEKLFEEIFHGAEPPLATERSGILVASPRPNDHASLAALLDALETDCKNSEQAKVLSTLCQLVPEYREPDHHAKETSP
ncbi:MAG: polysaccharide biosynthesis protein [Alphaproteobacteria bacterium]|nr:polysaccharide biosynthesis protein [Alphaproteobacteria bacterium]